VILGTSAETKTDCTDRLLANEVGAKVGDGANIEHILLFNRLQAPYEQDRCLQ
jgi:hypothetical protein